MVKINYKNLDISKELLNSFAKAITQDIKSFYESEKGKAYFQKWLQKHPEYNDK